jgi:hypothetical protein
MNSKGCFPGIRQPLRVIKIRHVHVSIERVVPRMLICMPPPSCARVIFSFKTSSTGCVHESEVCCQYGEKGTEKATPVRDENSISENRGIL